MRPVLAQIRIPGHSVPAVMGVIHHRRSPPHETLATSCGQRVRVRGLGLCTKMAVHPRTSMASPSLTCQRCSPTGMMWRTVLSCAAERRMRAHSGDDTVSARDHPDQDSPSAQVLLLLASSRSPMHQPNGKCPLSARRPRPTHPTTPLADAAMPSRSRHCAPALLVPGRPNLTSLRLSRLAPRPVDALLSPLPMRCSRPAGVLQRPGVFDRSRSASDVFALAAAAPNHRHTAPPVGFQPMWSQNSTEAAAPAVVSYCRAHKSSALSSISALSQPRKGPEPRRRMLTGEFD